ncbi:MAG: MGMT family protein [Eubacteriales bacterium]|nr:MGMT family protein [Eubacteriales bacterium]
MEGRKMTEELVYEVLSVVEEIPAGRVATYGQLARLTPDWPEQRLLLEAEGVPMKDETHVNLKRFLWSEAQE